MEDVIREEILAIEKEAEAKLRDIEEITMRHMKSPFTVYDPAHGEIQIELYSIIPIQSLDSLPSLDFIKPIEKLNEWKNSISMDRLNGDLSLPDMSGEWMPPFSGNNSYLKINHFFDTSVTPSYATKLFVFKMIYIK